MNLECLEIILSIIQKNNVMKGVLFYDALASHDTAEKVSGEDTLKITKHELTKSIKENISIDWNLCDSARAKIRVSAK